LLLPVSWRCALELGLYDALENLCSRDGVEFVELFEDVALGHLDLLAALGKLDARTKAAAGNGCGQAEHAKHAGAENPPDYEREYSTGRDCQRRGLGFAVAERATRIAHETTVGRARHSGKQAIVVTLVARSNADVSEIGKTPSANLRPRELAILHLYGEGLRTDQIAELLVLSPHTIRTHVRNARRHLGVSSRAEALDLLQAADPDPFI
jgi:DNA-binding CsgD family transcriptional regulator